MQTSSPRFKSLAVTAGMSFWFFVITSSIGVFAIEYLAIFVGITITITQVFAKKISKGLDVFAIINTKIFLIPSLSSSLPFRVPATWLQASQKILQLSSP